MKNIFKEIEENFPVHKIKVDGQQIWPYLRAHYYADINSKRILTLGERSVYDSSKLITGFKYLGSTLYGAQHWLGRYDFVAMSATIYRRKIDGIYYDIFLDPILDELGLERCLLIEIRSTSHYPKNNVHTSNIVSSCGVELVSWMVENLPLDNPKIVNSEILDSINERYGLRIPYAQLVKNFKSAYRLYTFIFKRFQAKSLLLACYYSREAAIKAAHDLGMSVIEVQHGIIGKNHPAYNVNAEIDKNCFPDHLLVFGRKELETFDKSRFINPVNVHPVGNFYIDHINTNHHVDPKITERIKHFKKIVGVTLQIGLEKRLMNFIFQAAKLNNDIGYIIIPRRNDGYINKKEFLNNIMMFEQYNFYEMMAYVDFHSTVYSTCALDALALGVQNILINIDNRSIYSYGNILRDTNNTRFINSPEEYIDAIISFKKQEKSDIKKYSEAFYMQNYHNNIKSFISTVY